MMIVPIAAAATAVMGLVASSARNMLQKHHVTSRVKKGAPLSSTVALTTASETVTQLQSMKRKELLELFLTCEMPSGTLDLQGDWNGCLLENNGWIMSSVTRFLTNGLFGRGRSWNGKAFVDMNRGVNRFRAKDDGCSTEYQHDFDFSIEPSRFSDETSITLRYNKYQFPLSLWYTMMDEVRCVPVRSSGATSDGQEPQVLIGFGCMAWSGGMLNASPFLLWRADVPMSEE